MVIQRILRHANVSTTATYYIKTAADDVRNAMAKLEGVIPTAAKAWAEQKDQVTRASFETLNVDSAAVPPVVN
jgi:hypothetical protein